MDSEWDDKFYLQVDDICQEIEFRIWDYAYTSVYPLGHSKTQISTLIINNCIEHKFNVLDKGSQHVANLHLESVFESEGTAEYADFKESLQEQ